MSVSKWAYSPKKCDGDYCPGDCDGCPKADEPSGVLIVRVEGYTINHTFIDVSDLIDIGDFMKIIQDDKTTLISKRDILMIEIEE